MKPDLIKEESRGIVHWISESIRIKSIGRNILISEPADLPIPWKASGSIALSWIDRLKAGNRFFRRAFRSGIHHVVELDDGRWLLCGFKRFFHFNPREKCIVPLPGRLHGGRPLALAAVRGAVYYGEYRGNPERSPVFVWRSRDAGVTWEKAFEFNQVRHIHGVYRDPFSDGIWVTTGDSDSECGIWVSWDDFESVQPVVGGSQQTRAVDLVFAPDHIYFGSDSPLERNFLYRFDRAKFRLERLQEVEGSVFYGKSAAGRYFFSTVVEPSAVNRARNAALWASSDGGRWERIAGFRKDFLPMRHFQYGQIRFPTSPGPADEVWATPFATELDQRSLLLNM